jgi:hypothetical protein
VEQEQPARADKPPDLREQRTGNTIRNMCIATLDITASKPPSVKGSRWAMSATANLTIEPNLARACLIASPDRSTAVTD